MTQEVMVWIIAYTSAALDAIRSDPPNARRALGNRQPAHPTSSGVGETAAAVVFTCRTGDSGPIQLSEAD